MSLLEPGNIVINSCSSIADSSIFCLAFKFSIIYLIESLLKQISERLSIWYCLGGVVNVLTIDEKSKFGFWFFNVAKYVWLQKFGICTFVSNLLSSCVKRMIFFILYHNESLDLLSKLLSFCCKKPINALALLFTWDNGDWLPSLIILVNPSNSNVHGSNFWCSSIGNLIIPGYDFISITAIESFFSIIASGFTPLYSLVIPNWVFSNFTSGKVGFPIIYTSSIRLQSSKAFTWFKKLILSWGCV